MIKPGSPESARTILYTLDNGDVKITTIIPSRPQEPKQFVFVYGTLLTGYYNNKLLRTSAFIDKGIMSEGFRMFTDNGMYPYLISDIDSFDLISGEVWAVDSNVLDSLDRLEGYTSSNPYYNHYERLIGVKIRLNSGQYVETYVYIAGKNRAQYIIENSMYIPHGDWRQFCKDSRNMKIRKKYTTFIKKEETNERQENGQTNNNESV
jgi:gamma-glutamylcyclotransferase (GGCT)/AIG2-like uncharacterized protein YtfP